MIVRDIVERPTKQTDGAGSSNPASALPPRPPVAPQRHGFPVAAHRSAGGSAFARARKEASLRASGGLTVGEGRIVDAVPAVLPASSSSVSSSGPSGPSARVAEAHSGSSTAPVPASPHEPTPPSAQSTSQILADVDAANRAAVQDMSDAQRAEEVGDLEERFGAGLMARLRARAEAKAKAKSQSSQSEGAAVARPPPVADVKETAESATAAPTGPEKSTEPAQPKAARKVRFDEDSTPAGLRRYFPDADEDDSKLEWMKPVSAGSGAGSVPGVPGDADDESAPRFDLSGAPLSAEAAADLPTHLGLHHHGAAPHLAGYTLGEIVHLTYSTVAGQRITMMGVLGRIVARYRAYVKERKDSKEKGESSEQAVEVKEGEGMAVDDAAGDAGDVAMADATEPAPDEPAWVTACADTDVESKGIDIACGVLGGNTRSVGVLAAAVELLFVSLGGGDWDWLDSDSACDIPFHPPGSVDGLPGGIASVPWQNLAPGLAVTLGLDLPPPTMSALIHILRRAALASSDLAEAVTPLLPPLLKAHVFAPRWPVDPASPQAPTPSLPALRLLRETVVSSRGAAEALAPGMEPLLRFVATAPTPQAAPYALETLRTLYALGRYGMGAGMATSAREIWSALGHWVASQCAYSPDDSESMETSDEVVGTPPTSSWTSPLIQAYFDLLRVWTVCAVDPHRTTPAHDLTWAAASALGWADEALSATAALLPSVDGDVPTSANAQRWRDLGATLGLLVEHASGARVNTPFKGRDELVRILRALREMDLVGHLPRGVAVMPAGEARDAFNAALTQVFRLHNVFYASVELGEIEPAAPSLLLDIHGSDSTSAKSADAPPRAALLESPERERLLWWFVATTQTHDIDVRLRAAVLVCARTEFVLDTAKWATSAFDLMQSFAPGDEPLALALVDDLLRADWSALAPASADVAAAASAAGIGHKDGLEILRPLLQHTILPHLEGLLGPRTPSPLYLKATGTLRPPAVTTLHRGPGLPLRPDWTTAPIDELLASGSSDALTTAPRDWDAGEAQVTRASLALTRIAAATATTPDPSLVVLDAMKVFMLEHGDPSPASTISVDTDVFRDAHVGASLKALLDSTSHPTPLAPPPVPAPLEQVALPFLGPGVPFFQFYTDLVALFGAISFGDPQFARVLVPPLAMVYPVDYRRLLWSDPALRFVRVPADAVPLETGTRDVFFHPYEEDRDVLFAYAKALVQRTVGGFMADIARHHVAALFWTPASGASGASSTGTTGTAGTVQNTPNTQSTTPSGQAPTAAQGTTPASSTPIDRPRLRAHLALVVVSSAPDDVLRAILEHDVDMHGTVGAAEVARRVGVVGELVGPKGLQRLQGMGYTA